MANPFLTDQSSTCTPLEGEIVFKVSGRNLFDLLKIPRNIWTYWDWASKILLNGEIFLTFATVSAVLLGHMERFRKKD